MISVYMLSEKELVAELERLSKVIKSGEATITDANRLDEVRQTLRRIREVKNNNLFPV